MISNKKLSIFFTSINSSYNNFYIEEFYIVPNNSLFDKVGVKVYSSSIFISLFTNNVRTAFNVLNLIYISNYTVYKYDLTIDDETTSAYICFNDVDAAKLVSDGGTSSILDYNYAITTNGKPYIQEYLNREQLKNNIQQITDCITLELITFKRLYIKYNLIDTNDPNFFYKSGAYININTGAAHQTGSNSSNGYTGFIEFNVSQLYLNFKKQQSGPLSGIAFYDENKNIISGTLTYPSNYILPKPSPDVKYVRFTLSTPDGLIDGFTETQYMVTEDGIPTEYRECEKSYMIDDLYINSSSVIDTDNITINEYNLSEPLLYKLNYSYHVSIEMPDKINILLNNTLRIYYRSIIKSTNYKMYDVYAVGSVGKNYPRYIYYKADLLGVKTMTIYVRDTNRELITSKTFSINVIDAPAAPSKQTNILVIGASATASGYIASEMNRRLTTSTGDNTDYNPNGFNLSNISFVGRKSALDIYQEATGGWSWNDYSGKARAAYRFYVSNVNELALNSVYRDSDSKLEFTLTELNVTGDSGQIKATFTGTGIISESGKLIKVSGNGDNEINYTSIEIEGLNPFFNLSTNELDFISYANEYCNGEISILISHCGMNDLNSYGYDNMNVLFTNKIKPFVRKFHTDFPNSKFIFSTLPLPSYSGGMGQSYGTNSNWNYYNIALKCWAIANEAHKMENEEEFNSYFSVADVIPTFDCESLYPNTELSVANRSKITETIQTNGVHPTPDGSKTVSDAILMKLCEILQN